MDRSGEIVLLRELNCSSDARNINRYVRITGFVSDMDPFRGLCRITHDNYSLLVDTALIGTCKIVLGSLFQFIGELKDAGGGMSDAPSAPVLILKARVCRCVDGMDMTLFAAALEARRRFVDRIAASIHPPA